MLKHIYYFCLISKIVNSPTMNIDVREYIRINPISAHELSISDAGDDGFMYFYDEVGENKYHVAL